MSFKNIIIIFSFNFTVCIEQKRHNLAVCYQVKKCLKIDGQEYENIHSVCMCVYVLMCGVCVCACVYTCACHVYMCMYMCVLCACADGV